MTFEEFKRLKKIERIICFAFAFDLIEPVLKSYSDCDGDCSSCSFQGMCSSR